MKRRIYPREKFMSEKKNTGFSLPSILLALGRGDEWLFRKDDNDRFIPRCWRWSAREKVRWIRRQEAVYRKIEDNVYRHSYPSSLYRAVIYVNASRPRENPLIKRSSVEQLGRRKHLSRGRFRKLISTGTNIGDRKRRSSHPNVLIKSAIIDEPSVNS